MTLLTPAQALAAAGRHAALSHGAAAGLWGVDLLHEALPALTVPRNRSRLVVPGWRVTRSDLAGDDVEEREGLRTTVPLRTVRDLSRVLPFAEALVAADSALRKGLLDEDTVRAHLGGATGRGAARLRRVAAAADPLSASVLETLVRAALLPVRPPPVSQYEVRDRWGVFVARVDLCWPRARLVVEADGYAFHSDRLAYRRDRERLNELERLGWRVLRFSWEDVVGRPDHVLALVEDCLRQAAA